MTGKEKIYIERQKNYTSHRGSFGPTGSISANGCGAIALYNVLMYFGIRAEFMTIVKRFSRLWPLALSWGGCMGSYITHLYYELKRYKFSVRPVFFTRSVVKKFHLDENSAVIFLYGWRKKWKLGAHYQAGFGNPDGTITLHNPKATYFGMKDLIKEKRRREKMWFCVALMIRKKDR